MLTMLRILFVKEEKPNVKSIFCRSSALDTLPKTSRLGLFVHSNERTSLMISGIVADMIQHSIKFHRNDFVVSGYPLTTGK
jgi:hypothetical protein